MAEEQEVPVPDNQESPPESMSSSSIDDSSVSAVSLSESGGQEEVPPSAVMAKGRREEKCYCQIIPAGQLEAMAKQLYFKQFRTLSFWFKQERGKDELRRETDRLWSRLESDARQYYISEVVSKVSKELMGIDPRRLTPAQREQLDFFRSEGKPNSWAKASTTAGNPSYCHTCSTPRPRLNPDLLRILGRYRSSTPINPPEDMRLLSVPATLSDLPPRVPAAPAESSQKLFPEETLITQLRTLVSTANRLENKPVNARKSVVMKSSQIKPRVEKKPKQVKVPAEKTPRKVKVQVEKKPKQIKPIAGKKRISNLKQEPARFVGNSGFPKKRFITLAPISQKQLAASNMYPPVVQLSWSAPTDNVVRGRDEQHKTSAMDRIRSISNAGGKQSEERLLEQIFRSTESEEQAIFRWMLGK